MSKTRKAHKKFFDDDYEYDDYEDRKDYRFQDRRKRKKLKNALRTKDIDSLLYNEEDYDY
jgi:hypothetical protein